MMEGETSLGVVKTNWIELGKHIPKIMIDENVMEHPS
jgi:hypothetical protein